MQWLSFGDYADAAAKVKQAGIPVIIMVQSVEEAVKAAALGADAVVAQVSFASAFEVLSVLRGL
jgi:NAD(P)H-dependent flavin oxidoreductase YrpB (nitropropane dioxygenase family)